MPELVSGFSIRQSFLCEMDKIDRFSVNVATFARVNEGNLQIALWDDTKGERIFSQTFRMERLMDGQEVACLLNQGQEGVRGHILSVELQAPGAVQGNTVAAWYADIEDAGGEQLYFNKKAVDGILCYSVSGCDNVWTGPHYWKIVLVFGSILGVYCLVLIYKKKSGKTDIVFTMAALERRYRFLLKQLVARDFKIKYRRSMLGILWSFMNPLLIMCVQYIVFSTIFKMNVENYPVYLLSGIVFFNYFTEVTNISLHAISGNAGLITKVYVPKVIYPFSKVLSSGINLLVSLLPLLIMSFLTGIRITKAWLVLPYGLFCLLVFCTGVVLMLSAVMVFFRDMQFIWSVLSMILNYVTPVFYPESILSESMRAALQFNPMYHYITFFRTVILEGISPEPWLYLKCLLFSIAFLVLAITVFRKLQDKFIFYI